MTGGLLRARALRHRLSKILIQRFQSVLEHEKRLRVDRGRAGFPPPDQQSHRDESGHEDSAENKQTDIVVHSSTVNRWPKRVKGDRHLSTLAKICTTLYLRHKQKTRMNELNFQTGPSSWDRDLQGIDADPEESENLAALGMHVAGAADTEEEEEGTGGKTEEAVEPQTEEPEELDALEELDRLAEELKQEDEPTLIAVDEEE